MEPSKARQGPRAFWVGLTLFLVYSLASSPVILRAHDGRRDSNVLARLWPELQGLARDANKSKTVRVIIQSRQGKRRFTSNEVVESGAILLTDLLLVNAVVAEVPGRSLREL